MPISNQLLNFFNDIIFTRYGIPREIMIDQGYQFTSNLTENLMKKRQIRNKQSTPYHPQPNGQVKDTNKKI